MRIFILLCTSLLFLVATGKAQVIGGTDEKLAKLYLAGKYESCLIKANDLTYKEKTSKDPEPYLYVSLCFYELSKSEDPIIREDYKDGFKQAVNYAAKFIKKDKEGSMYADNMAFINELKAAQFALVKEYFDAPDYRKAASATKVYMKLMKEEDFSILYFLGMCEILSNNQSQGSNHMEEARGALDLQLASGKVPIDSHFKSLLASGFFKYSEYLVGENQLQPALAQLEFGMQLFPSEGFLKVQHNMIDQKLHPKDDSLPAENN